MPTGDLGSRRDRVLGQLYDVPVNGDRPVGIRGAEAAGEYGERSARSRETLVNPYVGGLTLQDADRDEALSSRQPSPFPLRYSGSAAERPKVERGGSACRRTKQTSRQ